MLSKIFKRTFVVFIILMSIFLIGCQKTYKYPIHAQQCERIFNCTPTQLLQSEPDCIDTVGDFRKKSYVDKNGHLMLVLTEPQREVLIDWLMEFSELRDRSDIEVSDDLSCITIYYLPGLSESDSIAFENMSRTATSVAEKIVLIKMLNGVPDEDISILCIQKNIETGEVIYTETVTPAIVDP